MSSDTNNYQAPDPDDLEIDALVAIDREKGRASIIAVVAWAYAAVAGLAAIAYLAEGPQKLNSDPDWDYRILGVVGLGLSVALVVSLLLGLSAIIGLLAVQAQGEVHARLNASDDAEPA